MTFTITFETYEFQEEFESMEIDLNKTYPYSEDTYIRPDEDFGALCEQLVGAASELDDLIQEVIDHVGFKNQNLDDLVAYDLRLLGPKGKAYYIISVVGDDEHTTTNSVVFGILSICMAVFISGIKLSWKDVGISDLVGNYAEGWLILPPTAESTFEAVNRRSQRSGVAVLLDGVKLKMLSPVRKQSEMEQDLESKFNKLSDIAEWADSSWFTYDYHQMAKILGLVVFDYTSSRTFPFLYKTEGGCGGCPPYNNIDTSISGLFKYTRGKSIRAVLGVMTETGLIHAGEMSPKDSFFLKSAHIAQMGDKAWVEFTTAYRTLLENQQLTRVQAKNLVHNLRGSQLPQEYLDIATEVEMDDATMGVALSYLRDAGYLMTEIDVKMILNKIEKERAVFGTKPISQVIQDLDDSAALFKANHWKVLTELSLNDPTIKGIVNNMLHMEDETDYHSAAWKTMHRYYKIRTESGSHFSSFMYSDTVKVFKTSDIIRLSNQGSSSLRKDFTHTEGMERLWRIFENDTLAQAEQRERIMNWLDSNSLEELLKSPLPDGIGPDDARIYRSFENTFDDTDELVTKPTIFILVSSDKGLARTTDRLLRRKTAEIQTKHPGWTSASFVITREDYIQLCLAGLQEISSARQPGDGLATAKARAVGRKASERRISYYNFLLKSHYYYPLRLSQQIASQIRSYGSRSEDHLFRVVTEYDYPNLERGFETLEFRSDLNVVIKKSGGFLQRESLAAFPETKAWAGLPVHELYSWPDFDMSSKQTYRALAPRANRVLPDQRIRIYKVQGTSLYDSIDSWRR